VTQVPHSSPSPQVLSTNDSHTAEVEIAILKLERRVCAEVAARVAYVKQVHAHVQRLQNEVSISEFRARQAESTAADRAHQLEEVQGIHQDQIKQLTLELAHEKESKQALQHVEQQRENGAGAGVHEAPQCIEQQGEEGAIAGVHETPQHIEQQGEEGAGAGVPEHRIGLSKHAIMSLAFNKLCCNAALRGASIAREEDGQLLEKQERYVLELQQALEKGQAGIQTLKDQHDAEVERLRKEICELNTSVQHIIDSELIAVRVHMETELAKAHEIRVGNLDQTSVEQVAKVQVLEAQRDELSAQLVDVQTALNELITTHSELKTDHRQQVEAYQMLQEDLRMQTAEWSNKRQVLLAKCNASDVEHVRLSQENRDLISMCNGLRATLDELKQTHEQEAIRFADELAECKQRDKVIQNLKTSQDESHEKELDALQLAHDERVAELTQEVAKLAAETGRMHAETDTMHAETDSMHAETGTMHAETGTMQAQTHRDKAIQNLKTSLDEAHQREMDALTVEHNERVAELSQQVAKLAAAANNYTDSAQREHQHEHLARLEQCMQDRVQSLELRLAELDETRLKEIKQQQVGSPYMYVRMYATV
jgi:hypothetical protein